MLDADHCYRAVQSRDTRFDGWFVTAVRTTGIYCRPSCPAITPKRANVDFLPTAAAAQQRGFRACKRCRPDASPGSPEWSIRDDVVGRAMRLIGDGAVERDGVGGLARTLGYSERHLTRVLTDELGAGPLALARAQRAHTARVLVETTTMPFTDVAFAAGFGSVRQFNDTVREVFAASPTELRAAARRRGSGETARHASSADIVSIRLPVRGPFAADALTEFLASRAIPGIESWDGSVYRRTMRLEGGPAVVQIRAEADHVAARLRLAVWSDLAAAVHRVRRLLDLDADPVAVDDVLARTALAPLVAAVPGRRSPGSVDPFETLVRAVIGQQVSVAGARTVTARLVDAVGSPVATARGDHDAGDDSGDRDGNDGRTGDGGGHDDGGPAPDRLFPAPAELADAPDDAFSMPAARRDTIRRVARLVADGELSLHAGADPDRVRARLLEVRGIGPWTADYVVMRGLGHPDTFLGADLGVRHALAALDLAPDVADRWAPWRSYAVHHLWASLDAPPDSTGASHPPTSPRTGARR